MPVPDVRRLVNSLKSQWASLSDDEKQVVLDGIAEFAGGTAGAVAGGGWASIPAAGAGAVAGRNLVSRPLGKLMGLSPSSSPQTAGEELAQTAKTFAANAAGEGLGRAASPVYKGVKSLATRAIRKQFQPTAEARILQGLATKYGVPLNLGQATGSKRLQSIEIALDRNPLSVDTVRKAREGQYKAWEGAINGYLDKLHGGDITQEEFARVTEQTFAKLRGDFNARVSTSATKAAESLSKKPVSGVEAGEALKAGREANLDVVRDWAKGAYGKVRAKYGNAEIDLKPMVTRAQDLLDSIPEGERSKFFPSKVLKYLQAGSAKDTVAAPYTKIAPSLEGDGFVAVGEGITTTKVAPTLTLAEAMDMRSQLLDAARRLNPRSNPMEVRTIHEIVDGVNEAMEVSLGKTPETKQGLQELRNLNRQYRGYMENLKPAMVKGKSGNPAARVLQNAEQPEKLPGQITASPTLTEGTITASSPQTTAKIGSAGPDPLPQLQRHIFDEARREATITNPATGQSRVSPTAFAPSLPPAAPELYGRNLPTAIGLSKPQLVAREQQLFNSPLAKAVDSGDTGRIYGEAFPRREPETARVSLQILGETGDASKGQRGFVQRLLDSSRTQDVSIGDSRYLNPRTLERHVEQYGETVPAVLGPRTKGLHELAQLGESTVGEGAFRNPSGTSRGNEAVSFLRRGLNPLKWPGMAAEAASANYAAKKFYDPAFVGKMTAPLPPPPSLSAMPAGGPLLGTAGRAIMAMPQMPERKQQGAPPEDMFADAPPEDYFAQ